MPSTFPLHFARYHEIAVGVASQLLAARGDDPLAPWTHEVVVASQGMAEAISRELLRARPEGVAAVRLQSVETLARRIVNAQGEFPRAASDAERRLAMRAAVRSVKDTITQSRGIASMLDRSYRDLRDSNLTLADFRRRADGTALRHPERVEVIARVWTEYERIISSLGAVDPADLIRRASRIIRESLSRNEDVPGGLAPQIVAGFYDMTGVQTDFCESLRLAGRLAAFYIPGGDGEAYRFSHTLTTRLAEHAETGGAAPLQISRPRPTIERHERAESEIASVCGAIAALLRDGVAPESIGIVARSLGELDAHLFNRYATAAGFHTTREESTPLKAHRVGRTALAILRLREHGFPRGEVLEVLRGGLKTSKRLDLDAIDVETRRKRIPGGTSDELRKSARSPLLDDYVSAVRDLEALTAPLAEPLLRGSAWSELVAAITSRITLTSSSDLDAARALDEIATLFARADASNVRFDATQVAETIEHATLDVARQEIGPRVWLGDVMKMRGRTFEHLFAVHMQEEAFPQRRVEDPLLPDRERRALGIREVGDGRDEEHLLFQLLFDAARMSIRFSFAATDGFGKALRPSQLLKNFAIVSEPERKSKLLRDFTGSMPLGAAPLERNESGGKPPHSIRALQLIANAGTNSPFDGFFREAALREHFAKRLESMSPTQLEDFGECPQKFLVRHVLGARELEDPERELQINARDKGSADHHILERFYRAMTDEERTAASIELPRLPEKLATRLDAAIDAEFNLLEETAPPFNPTIREIERRATRRILRDFVVRDLLDSIATGLVPKFFEYRFGSKYARERAPDHAEAFVLNAGAIPLTIEGQIDRIDSDGQRYRIVDYKSGKALRHDKLAEKIDRGVRLQLATYAMAVAEFFDLSDVDVSGTIKAFAAIDSKQKLSFELADKREVIQQTLDTFASAIASGHFPAFPDDGEIGSCKYCPVKHSCRTRHDPAERYAARRNGEALTLLRNVEDGA